jgi:uncharacterized membrane protein
MTQPTQSTRRRSLLGAFVFTHLALTAVAGFMAGGVALVARRARRDEAGFGEISQAVALGAIGVVAIIAALALFRPVLADIIDKIRTDVLGQNP